MGEGHIIASRFQVDKLIGQGGMGEVYRGIDLQTNQIVAIKLLKTTTNPDLIERFEREAEALRRLNHPNIVKVLASVEEDGQHYIVMEYVGGGALDEVLAEHPQQPIDRVMDIALDLADALTRAHRLKIIHRDIKPANVLLAEDSTPRLSDFGVAHIEGRAKMTETGALVGTYAYLSPEACHGKDLDDRTDIWAFGVMLFEMVAGQRPFEADQIGATITAILTHPLPDLKKLRPDTPDTLVTLINRMLEKDRDKRIPSVRQVGAELEAMMRGLEAPTHPTPHPGDTPLIESSRFATPTPTPPGTTILMDTDAKHHVQVIKSDDGREFLVVPRRMTILPRIILPILLVAVVVLAALLLSSNRGASNTAATPTGLQIEPVKAGEYMVLVGEIEHLGGVERDVTRFITDNLKQTLEVDVPFSHVRIRQYPGIISSAEQAKAAAEAAGAVVVVWGNYNQNFVELQVQLGTIQNFTRNKFARDVLERTINVRVQMTDERQQSVAQPVLSVLTVLQTADGNMYDMMQTAATYQEIKVKAAEIIGDSVAAHVHRHVRGFFNDIPSGIQEMNAALALDGGNALLYLYRALLYSRTSDFASATRDAQTAVRLGPAEWAAPYYALAGDEIYSKELISYSTIIKLRPDDWFPLSLRGWVWDLRGDYKQAQTDFERAVALQPNANMPYMLGAMTALHQGRINDAVSLLDTGLKKFPDPTASSRAIRAAMGENVGGIFAQYISLPGYLALGQYEDVKRIAQDTSSNLANAGALMALTGFGPDNDSKVMQSTLNNSLADVYLYTGLAQCNLRLYPPAEAAYTSGIKANPNFTLLYLLRAEIRMKVSKSLAQEDLDAIQKSPQAEAFAPYRAALEAGKLTCENVLTTQNPVLAGRGS